MSDGQFCQLASLLYDMQDGSSVDDHVCWEAVQNENSKTGAFDKLRQ